MSVLRKSPRPPEDESAGKDQRDREPEQDRCAHSPTPILDAIERVLDRLRGQLGLGHFPQLPGVAQTHGGIPHGRTMVPSYKGVPIDNR